jgi:putative membrane protein
MLVDHTGVNQLVNDLIAGANITPEENKTSLDFRDESSMKRDLMRELSGRAFDTTYIANEISYHTRLLASIDGTLLPAARNAQLKQLITTIRPAVAAHLAHAQQVRTGLPAR